MKTRLLLANCSYFLFLFLFVNGLASCKQESTNISAEKAKKLIESRGAILLDVRTEEEYYVRTIDKAILLPYDELNSSSAAKVILTRNTPVIVFCNSGRKSSLVVEKLKKIGYTEVFDLGSINNWK